MKIQTTALVAITGDSQWSLESISIARCLLGRGGWQHYLTKLSPSAYTWTQVAPNQWLIHFSGEGVLDLLATFDTVITWHWIPPKVIRWIKERSDGRTKVYVDGLSVDAIMTRPHEWNPIKQPIHDFLMTQRLVSDTRNRFSDYFVDIYESYNTPYERGPHAWAIDVGNLDWIAFVDVVARQFAEYYPDGARPDGLFADSVRSTPYWGTASNKPPLDSIFTEGHRLGWKSVLERAQALIAPVLCHTGGVPTHDDWGVDYPALQWLSEHFLVNSMDPRRDIMQTGLDGLKFGIGQDRYQRFREPASRWADILVDGDSTPVSHVSWETLRDGHDCYLWYPTELDVL